MSIRPILRMGHPVLARVADPVADPTTPKIRALVDDMGETMRAAGGRGIAAPQVGVPLRLVIFHAPLEDEESRSLDGAPLTVLVNPVIEPLTEETTEGFEGCLSVPGLRGMVPRVNRIRYRGTTPEGEVIDRVAQGFHARVVQHECDHLDGVLYPQRMTDLSTLMFTAMLALIFRHSGTMPLSEFFLGPRRTVLQPGELMRDIKSGFYITELIGMGVNGITGDYSRGAAGFWIENGEIAYPVNEVTIAGNLLQMFKSLTPANDLEFRYGTNAPTLRIDSMTVAGN